MAQDQVFSCQVQGPGVSSHSELGATRTSLLRGACDNDQLAWQRLVDRYSRSVYLQARDSGLGDAEACDVMQEVLLKVAQRVRQLRRERVGSFRRWLESITSNTIIDHVRHGARRVQAATGGTTHLRDLMQIEDSSESSYFAQARLDPALQAIIGQVQAKAAPRTWSIYQRLVADECDPAVVAEEHGVSVSQVWVIRSRMTKRIRKAWEARQQPN